MTRRLAWIAAIVTFVIVLTGVSRRPASAASNEPEMVLDTMAHAAFDRDHHVEIHSGENSVGDDQPVFSDVSHTGDVWLLRQYEARLGWRRFAIVVRNRRVYFASIDPRLALPGAECAECHPNGPRAIHGPLLAGSEVDRNAMNGIISNVHVALLYYPAAEPAPRVTHALTLSPCVDCHDG